jgi:hypothetical protein
MIKHSLIVRTGLIVQYRFRRREGPTRQEAKFREAPS